VARLARQSLKLHGPLTTDPKASIERTVTIPVLKRKVQVQTLILSGTSLAVAIALLLKKEEKEHETKGPD
jgi:hypothetical protein